jgi:hypothetical protein
MKTQVLWDVTLCCWMCSSFQRAECLLLALLDPEGEGTKVFESSGTARPTTRLHVPEDLKVQVLPLLHLSKPALIKTNKSFREANWHNGYDQKKKASKRLHVMETHFRILTLILMKTVGQAVGIQRKA